MTAPPATARYVDRKSHDCGCVTVWDTERFEPRFEGACGVHRRYAHHWWAR